MASIAPLNVAATPDTATKSAAVQVPGTSCHLFPADNVWNTDVSSLPADATVTANTQALFNSSGSARLHPDFGPPSYGIPYAVVNAGHASATKSGNPSISFGYPAESDEGPYAVGSDIPIENGSDRHALTVNSSTCRLAELFDAQIASQPYTAGSGAVWDLNSNALRPDTWTSADAAGLPILPGLVRSDEVQAGAINHALRFTLSSTANRYVWPARHQAGSASPATLPPMGSRYRLKASFDISGYPGDAQVVLRAMQHYGMFLADNGADWYFQGTVDPSWTYSFVDSLKTVPASAFEAVDESSLIVDPNSGQVGSACAPTILPPATTGCAVRNLSYHVDSANDGTTWLEVDPGLRVTATPNVAETALVSLNIDLWTANAGYNQDVGIFMTENYGADQFLGWKESGGFAGTYSPNAAMFQGVVNLTAGHTYVFKMKLKPNIPAPAGTVYAAAGTAQTQFSPTRMTVHLVPTANVYTAAHRYSYHLDSDNDGGFGSWVEIDPTLDLTVPGSSATAIVTGNMDLWTTRAGYNQDLGLFVSDNGGPDQQLAWKESGGFAGTFSPNAAFVQFAYSMTAGHNYRFKLKWKPNIAAPGGTVYGSAGTTANGFSPTRLTVQVVPASRLNWQRGASSYNLGSANDGGFSSWVELNPQIRVPFTPATSSVALVGASMDLWTSQPGFNQDLGLFVCDSSVTSCASFSSFSLLAWKESGGFAGTFSPNAAYAEAVLGVSSAHNYVFALGWKPNLPAPGGVIYGAAGTASTEFSPTSLVVLLA